MEPLEKTFICWPNRSINTDSIDQDKLPFMYLKMTADGMAEFYNDFQLKSMITSFKTKPFSSSTNETLSFEADRTDELLSKLKKLQEEIDREDLDIDKDSDIAEMSCIFLFYQDGPMGHVLYSFDTVNSTLTA